MKILYHHRVVSRDGQAVHLEELAAALRRMGAEVVVVGPESFARSSFGHDPRFISWLKKLTPKILYELLEIGYNVVAYQRLAKAARQQRPDLIYERYSLGLIAGVWLKRRYGIPLLLEVNAPLVAEKAEFGGIGWKGLASWVEARIWRSADLNLPVTEVLATHVRAAGVPNERIRVIANAIDPRRFSGDQDGETYKRMLGLSGKLLVGFTGFMRTWHGLDAVLNWLADGTAPDNVHVLIVGDGPAKSALEAQAGRLGLNDRITFTGLIDRDAIARTLTSIDIAIQPKCVSYASPLKLFEYMALGKAIVAPDQPNIREVLEHEVSALLFDPAAPHSLANALERLAYNEGLRTRLGAGAKEAIRLRDFTWDGNARRVLTLATLLLGGSMAQTPITGTGQTQRSETI